MISPKDKWKRCAGCMIAIAFLSLFQISATAQTEQGRYLIGGSGDLSETYDGGTSIFNFSISPSFGVFAVKNFAIGAKYSVTIGNTRSYDASQNSYSSVFTLTTLVGPFLKYYLGKKAVKGLASFTGGYSVYTALSSSGVTNLNGFSLQGAMGVAYFFNRYISLETALYLDAAGYQTLLPSTRVGISVGLFGFLDKKKPSPQPPAINSQ